MSKMQCRLCLNEGKLIDTFDNRLSNSEQLRKCILLGTGVEIRHDDQVSKFICQYCSDIAIFLYKYRKKALSNDKALKELYNQPYVEPYYQSKDIVRFNRVILNELTAEEDGFSKPPTESAPEIDKPKNPKRVTKLAVHPTIIELVKMYPTVKIPNDVIRDDIQPTVVLDAQEAEGWLSSFRHGPMQQPAETAIERFRQMCPGISIMKIKGSFESALNMTTAETSVINHVPIKNKRSESPHDVPKKRRMNSTSSTNSEAKSEASIRATRKRSLQTPTPSKELDRPILKTLLNRAEKTIQNEQDPLPVILEPEQAEIVANQEPAQDEEIVPRKRRRRRVLSTDSESSYAESTETNHEDRMYSLLDTVDEEIVIHCGICNKMFNTRQQQKSHERVHRCCIICKNIFRSADALWCHQQDICFKTVITNQPILELVRVDEEQNIVKTYPKAFPQSQTQIANTDHTEKIVEDVLCISDDEDDVVIVNDTDNTTNTSTATNPDRTNITNNQEFQHVCRVFRKYKEIKIPLAKHKGTETKPRIFVKYNQKSQIVLENMYPELQIYRVPIDLVEKTTSFAYISFSKKSTPSYGIYCWATEPVIGLSPKKSSTAILPNAPSVPTTIPSTPSNPTPVNVVLNTLQPSRSPITHIAITNLPHPVLPPPSPSAIKPGLPQGNVQPAGEPVQEATSSSSVCLGFATSNQSMPELVLSTSTAKDTSFGLRVKTLSELNSII